MRAMARTCAKTCVIALLLSSACEQARGSDGGNNTDHVERPPPVPVASAPPPVSSASGTAVPSTSASMTPAQWLAARNPQNTATHVQTRGCEPVDIDSEYRVLPSVACSLAPEYDLETNPVRNCVVEPYCIGPEDCTEGPRGRCEGLPSPRRCVYPASSDEPCTSDKDCTRLGTGQCAHSVTEDFLCYPTGECSPPGGYCAYDVQLCNDDVDCKADVGGRCLDVIEYATCTYDECTGDEHCAEGQRCGCFKCLDASCATDADCGSEQACKFWQGCGVRGGYDCTSADDECVPGQSPCECVHVDGRFSCSRRFCE